MNDPSFLLPKGMRYKRRGVDTDGHVANFVETEQLIHVHNHSLSFVQSRGSVPVFWSQAGYRYNPRPRLEKGQRDISNPKEELGNNGCVRFKHALSPLWGGWSFLFRANGMVLNVLTLPVQDTGQAKTKARDPPSSYTFPFIIITTC